MLRWVSGLGVAMVYKGLGQMELRFCKTAVTWLRSLSAILPLFWRHDIAELHRLYRGGLRNVLWRHDAEYEKCSFHSILQRKWTFSSLTWLGCPMFYSIYKYAQQPFYDWFLIRFKWSDFLRWWIIWFENFHFLVIFTQVSSQTLSFNTFLSIWK